MTKKEKREFFEMAMDLSPENLYCDGECSQAEANRKYESIMKRWTALEKKVGKKVSEFEAFQFRLEF